MTTYYHQVYTARNQAKRKRLNDYIIEHGCYPPPCKKQVPLSVFFTPTIRSDSTNNRSDEMIGPKNSVSDELCVEDDVPLMPVLRNQNSNTDDL